MYVQYWIDYLNYTSIRIENVFFLFLKINMLQYTVIHSLDPVVVAHLRFMVDISLLSKIQIK